MYRKLLISVTSLLLSGLAVFAQEDSCPTIIQNALTNTDAFCQAAGRNQACYGHVALEASPQPDVTDFQFGQMGDIVNVASISSLRLSPLDTDQGEWGVVLMRVQANLPDTLPGQNVTMMLFGDTEIRNAAASVSEQSTPTIEMSIAQAANIRVGPNTNSSVLTSFAAGTPITANGRLADNSWIRIVLPDFAQGTGWVFAPLVSGTDAVETLKIVETDAPEFGPMQAFYLTTGIGDSGCKEAPESGMLVQTPEGASTINLTINEVQVELASTVYFQARRGEHFSAMPIEGSVRFTHGDDSKTAVAGSWINIPIDDDFQPSGAIEDPMGYDDENFDALPVHLMEREIDIAESLDEDELNMLRDNEDLFNALDLDDVHDVFSYLDETEDPDMYAFMRDELGYDEFDAELAEIMEEDFGYDFEGIGEDESFEDSIPLDTGDADFFDDDFSDDSFDDDFFDDGFDDDSFDDDFFDDDFSDDDFSDDDFDDDGGDDDGGDDDGDDDDGGDDD